MDGVGRIEANVALDGAADIGTDPGDRSRKRDSLFLSARLRFGAVEEVFDVRVRNLSAGGLMAELDRVVDAGTSVGMEMRGLGELTGIVVWCTRGRLGIAFDHPIDPTRARKQVGSGSRTPDYAKPLIVTAPRR